MTRIALIVAAAAALLLAGCATNYEHYAKAIEAQAKYQAVAETERASAFKAALESADPVARAVAANGLGITEALRVTGRGGGNGVTAIAPPKTMLEEAATLIGAFNPWVAAGAQIYGIKKGADVAIAAQQANVDAQRVQSAERISTTGSLVTLGTAGINGTRDTAASGFGAIERTAAAAFKNPTYNVSVFGSENNLFGSTSTRTTTTTTTTTTSTNNCTGGNTSNSGTTTPTATGGAVPCDISK